MGLRNALRLYGVRLRARLPQECCAVLGIAAGVALLFAAEVSNTSLHSSLAQLTKGLAGGARLQLVARGQEGFPEGELARVRRIAGVRAAAPVLEAQANAVGPGGSRPVELLGADASLAALGGTLAANGELTPMGGFSAVVLPAPLAHSIGASSFGQRLTFELAGRIAHAELYETLGERRIGPLAASPIALAPLSLVQEMAGLPARVSTILVEADPGREASVRARLQALADGRLNVEPVGYEGRLFSQAASASDRSTALFAAISALVGFLFAFNAMLLTVGQRRSFIAGLRREGYTPGSVVAIVALDALILGAVACGLGLALGEELSVHLFGTNPAFLSLAFALGSQRVVDAQSVAIAVAGGMLAAIVAVLSPLPDILSRDPLAAIAPREQLAATRAGGCAAAGLACLGGATAILLAAPGAAIPGMALLLAALLLELPIVLAATLALARRAASRTTSIVPHVAAMELGSGQARAVAIAATGAIAVFGSVAIAGAHDDLLEGLQGASRAMNGGAELWVAPAGSYDLLQTAPFAPVAQRRLERLPGVRAVRIYRSGLLDFGDRRVLVLGPPAGSDGLLGPSELIGGGAALARKRLSGEGWIVVSQALAGERGLRVGDTVALPTTVPMSFRIAALSTNFGWAPGAVVMSAGDYARAWGSDDASAFEVVLARGFPVASALAEIRRALGPGSGLAAQSAAQRVSALGSLNRQALARLTQIAAVIPIAAVLAMAAAMGALVWQRRPRLAKLKLEGLSRGELWLTVLLESLLLVGAGCLAGAAFGLYGQQLADRALVEVVNFPVVHSVSALTALTSLGLVSAAAMAILALPGYLAACVPAAVALQD